MYVYCQGQILRGKPVASTGNEASCTPYLNAKYMMPAHTWLGLTGLGWAWLGLAGVVVYVSLAITAEMQEIKTPRDSRKKL